MADLLGEIVGIEVVKNHAPPKKGDIDVSIGDASKLDRSFGLKVETPLKQGLAEVMKKAKKSNSVSLASYDKGMERERT